MTLLEHKLTWRPRLSIIIHILLLIIIIALWSKDVITLSTSATSPAQILGPLALFRDPHLRWVKSPEPVFSEEEEMSIWTGQSPVCPPRHAGPVCQPAGVVMLWDHGSEVEHVVAGTLKDDHVTQGGVIEGGVGMTREPQVADLPGETRVQHSASVAPHLLPCRPRTTSAASMTIELLSK